MDDRCNELTREIVELNKKKEIYEVEICEMTNIIETCKAELITEKVTAFTECNVLQLFDYSVHL